MTRLFRTSCGLTLAVMAIGLAPSHVRADLDPTPLTIQTGNGSPNTTVQIVEETHATGTTFYGENNQLGIVVKITTDVTGTVSGTGQAKILSGKGSNFTTVTFDIAGQDSEGNAYLGWTGFEVLPIFDKNKGWFTVEGTYEGGGTYSETFEVDNGNGQNRFFVLPNTVQYISRVVLETLSKLNPPTLTANIDSVRQIRIGGVYTDDGIIPGPNPVPEPSSLALAIGCIAPLAAIGVIRRRRQLKANAA